MATPEADCVRIVEVVERVDAILAVGHAMR
jgi:hypothetical protein